MLLPLSLLRHILCRRRSVTLFSADVLTPVLLVLFERILYRYSSCWMLYCCCSTFVVDTLSPLMCVSSSADTGCHFFFSGRCFATIVVPIFLTNALPPRSPLSFLWRILCHYCSLKLISSSQGWMFRHRGFTAP